MSRKKSEYKCETLSIPNNAMFLYGACRAEWSPKDVSGWIDEHNSDQSLADMCARVHNHVGMLFHALQGDECDRKTFHRWTDVQDRLTQMILERLAGNVPEVDGTYNKIKPFMKRHGYVDGGGWWTPENDDNRPPSVYVPVTDFETRKKRLLELFSGLPIIAHVAGDPGYENLEEGYTEYEIDTKGMSSHPEIWLLLPDEDGEITFRIGDWHAHYYWYEYDLQCLEWEIEQILTGKTVVLTLYAGDQCIGSTLFRDNPRNSTYWQMLNYFHLTPEQKEDVKQNGARLIFGSPIPEKELSISYSWNPVAGI